MEEFERYFFALDKDDKPIAVYRLVNNSVAFAEEVWQNNEWQPTTSLTEALIEGSTQYVEVPLETAQQFIAANGNSSK